MILHVQNNPPAPPPVYCSASAAEVQPFLGELDYWSDSFNEVINLLGYDALWLMLSDFAEGDNGLPYYLLPENRDASREGISLMIALLHADPNRDPDKIISYKALEEELRSLKEYGLLDFYAEIGVSLQDSANNDLARFNKTYTQGGYSILPGDVIGTPILGVTTDSLARKILSEALEKDTPPPRYVLNAVYNAYIMSLDQDLGPDGFIDLVNAWLGYDVSGNPNDPTKLGDFVEFNDYRNQVIMDSDLIRRTLGKLGLAPGQQTAIYPNQQSSVYPIKRVHKDPTPGGPQRPDVWVGGNN